MQRHLIENLQFKVFLEEFVMVMHDWKNSTWDSQRCVEQFEPLQTFSEKKLKSKVFDKLVISSVYCYCSMSRSFQKFFRVNHRMSQFDPHDVSKFDPRIVTASFCDGWWALYETQVDSFLNHGSQTFREKLQRNLAMVSVENRLALRYFRSRANLFT